MHSYAAPPCLDYLAFSGGLLVDRVKLLKTTTDFKPSLTYILEVGFLGSLKLVVHVFRGSGFFVFRFVSHVCCAPQRDVTPGRGLPSTKPVDNNDRLSNS